MKRKQKHYPHRLHLTPQESKPGMTTVRDGELIEAMMFGADPKARSRDILLLRAKRETKHAKAAHLSDSELRGVSWFAHVPTIQSDSKVFDESNFYASSFWAAWKRDPDTVLRLTKMIRDTLLNEVGDEKKAEAILVGKNKLPKLSAENYERIKGRVKRARKQLKPPENVKKFAAKLRNS